MSMQALLAASQSMAKMQTIQSARTQMQGTANVLRIESKQNGGDEGKDAQVKELEKKSNNLMSDFMDEVADVTETMKPEEDVKAEEKEQETNTAKDPRTDTVTLSDRAAGYKGALPKADPAMGESVTYDVAGSKTASAPTKATATFEATA